MSPWRVGLAACQNRYARCRYYLQDSTHVLLERRQFQHPSCERLQLLLLERGGHRHKPSQLGSGLRRYPFEGTKQWLQLSLALHLIRHRTHPREYIRILSPLGFNFIAVRSTQRRQMLEIVARPVRPLPDAVHLSAKDRSAHQRR
jgi:hypothetical protein